MTNSETFNEIIIAYCCRNLFDSELIDLDVHPKKYNYYFSLPPADFHQFLRDTFHSFGSEGLLFDCTITGYIGYELYLYLTGKQTIGTTNSKCLHMMAEFLSLSICHFNAIIPPHLQTSKVKLSYTVR